MQTRRCAGNPMSERYSVYLDLVRFLAAMVVLLSHFAYPRFTDGSYLLIRELNLGSDAVVIFFVLSGFIIAHTVHARNKPAQQYFFDRTTRLLSVAVPALAITFILDRLGWMWAPASYDGWWYNSLPMWEYFAKGLTFSNEWTWLAARLGTNGPYWSLSYEAAYYMLFGLFLFTSGIRRVVLIFAGCLLFGLNILLLAPCWFLGVVVDRLCRKNPGNPNTVHWIMATGPLLLYAWLVAIALPGLFAGVTNTLIGPEAYAGLRFSNEFVWNFLIAGLFAVHMIGCQRLMVNQEWRNSIAVIIRWLAGATFSIYLIHYPALQFFSSVVPKTGSAGFDHGILLGLTLVTCFGFAEVFERRLGEFRQVSLRMLRRLGSDGHLAARS